MDALAAPPAGDTPPSLSYTRLLRRVTLTLRGQFPTVVEYLAILNAPDDGAREALIQETIDDALTSEDFHQQMLEFGYDTLGVGTYSELLSGSAWKGSQAIQLQPCGSNTLHAGRLGTFAGNATNSYPDKGDSVNLCDDPEAMTHEVEPWWAPGTTVGTIGWAGAETTEVPDEDNPGEFLDCGLAKIMLYNIYRIDNQDPNITPRCSCGPNLIYCARRSITPGEGSWDGFEHDPSAQRRAVFEESARLFAHVIMKDRPFTDIILGDYTVVNQGLQHMYVRAARMNPANAWLDAIEWWKAIVDPNEWREIVVQDMNPMLLADRNTTFDPSVDMTEPPGIPSAGVLTTYGSLGSFTRERPRAARWLETLACREFIPAPPNINFTPYETDPATQGVCQNCHKIIDPVAIHFKRFSESGVKIAGMNPWKWNQWKSYDTQIKRWDAQFIPNTVLTPVDQTAIDVNPDARFIDFLPPGSDVLGATGDGTIGPLGFAKMLVQSGEFDQCMVRRFYKRFTGLWLDPALHQLYIDKLVQVYTDGGKKMKPFIQWILNQPRFRMGR
jgi:hypothetical protein